MTNDLSISALLLIACFGVSLGLALATYAVFNKWETPEHYRPLGFIIAAFLFILLFVEFATQPSILSMLMSIFTIFLASVLLPMVGYYEWQNYKSNLEKQQSELALQVIEQKPLTTDEKLAQILQHNKRK